MVRFLQRGLGLLIIGGLVGCLSPSEAFDARASRAGLIRSVVSVEDAWLVVYRAPESRSALAAGSSEPGRLHVYLSGDGAPASASAYSPPDPTPRRGEIVELLALDPSGGILLGRPCYHGTPCPGVEAWTVARYGERVLEPLAAALEQIRAPGQRLVLIGHSGGGTLAVLLAARVPGVDAVVTIAGNLDPEAWSQHHGFTPLRGSLNPSEGPPLHPAIVQLHLMGGKDEVVPPELGRRFLEGQSGARIRVFPELGHDGGWAPVWPLVLRDLERALPRAP